MDDDSKNCRSATAADLKNLINSLNEHNVPYLLIGGYSLFAHGYIRATTDIDILVPPTFECGEKIKKALLVLPDQVSRDIDPNWFIDVESDDHGNIRVADEFVVDIMFNACGETFQTLGKYSQVIYIDNTPVKTVNLEGLLKTKMTTRSKDVSDRMVIERALHEIQLQSQANITPIG